MHVDEDGNNAIIVAPLANNHINTNEIATCAELIASADIFITQLQVNTDAVIAAMKIASEAGVPIVLNPAPAKEIPYELFEMADYITPNETEAEFYCGTKAQPGNLDAIADKFTEMGARNVIVTLGSRGAYFRMKDGGSCVVPAFSVQVVDSTAAGDAFNAAFAFAVAQGKTLSESVRFGNAAGAITTSRRGSQVSLPTATEVCTLCVVQ